MQQSLKELSIESFPINSAENPVLAALDIGSNSFHLIVVRRVGADFQILERLKEQVQLAAGLNDDLVLDDATTKRALNCLDNFTRLLKNVPPENIRAVATHTLRVAKNSEKFLSKAAKHFPVPVKVISGTEEARLIYMGAAHISDIKRQMLVMDIGGGSTEFIIGSNFEEKRLCSQPIGCVNLTKKFLRGGKLDNGRFHKMVDHCEEEIGKFRKAFLKTGWELCLGSSGSIKTVSRILKAEGYNKRSITIDHLFNIRERLLECKHLTDIEIEGVVPPRAQLLPAAVAILIAAFKLLEIERMEYSRGALREGLLYDMITD